MYLFLILALLFSACSQLKVEAQNVQWEDSSPSGYLITQDNAETPIGPILAGVTTRYWDCCKPSCGWSGNAGNMSQGPVRSCSMNGVTIAGINEPSGCGQGGTAFPCNNNQPFVVGSTAYGFAAAAIQNQPQTQTCCACYKLTFTSGPVVGQTMIVQATNTGSDLTNNHFDLQIPGGGVGLFNGCTAQWNAPSDGWGERYGGVSSTAQCDQLPSQIRPGCLWRFQWFQGAHNPSMNFQQIVCPSILTSISGCNHN